VAFFFFQLQQALMSNHPPWPGSKKAGSTVQKETSNRDLGA
jgi:hypothetical protein